MEDHGSLCLDETPGAGSERRGRIRGWCHGRYDSPCAILLGLLGIVSLGVILGLALPSSSSSSDRDSAAAASASQLSQHDDTAKWDDISNILGYTYFLSWTLSFYPQIITNWKFPSKALHGVSLDFVVWNIVGFGCYAIYTTSFMYSDVARREYAERFGGDIGGGGDDDAVAGNGTAVSLMRGVLSAISGEMANYYQDPANTNNTEIPNPFNRTWASNSTTADDSSSNNNTMSDGSNATSTTDDGSNSGDAVALPQVRGNDVAFAWHALLLAIITFLQIVWCSGRPGRVHDKASTDEGWVEGEDDLDLAHVKDGRGGLIADEEDDFVYSNIGGREDSPDHRMEEDNPVGDHQPENQSHLQHILQQRQDQEQIMAHNPTDLMPSQSNIHWTKRISSTTKVLILLLLTMCVAGAIMVACNVNIACWGGGDQWQWIDYLYFLSFVKVGVSFVKYIPQVALNYRRKSTSGWQIWNILLDFSGGTLSIVQLVGDSLAEANSQGLPHGWTGIIGNPAKFGLGLVSIFFDVIFMIQHYVLYRHPSSPRHSSSGQDAFSNGDYEAPLLQRDQ